MKTLYDVQQLLKRFGAFIYTGDRLGDLALMEMEIEEYKNWAFIDQNTYMEAKLVLRQEKRKHMEGENK